MDEPPPARARDILRKYLENPRMADTLEGIAEWMLLEEMVQRGVEETQAALKWLVARGFLRKVTGSPAAPPLYSLEQEHADDARRFVTTGESTPDEGAG